MTQTIQRRSWTTLYEPGKCLTINQTVEEENINLMSSLAAGLNDLQKELRKMINVHNSLCNAREYYLQATKEATQTLASLLQDKEKGGKNEA
jgi:hypothetical protein